jgi:hypothetical protein
LGGSSLRPTPGFHSNDNLTPAGLYNFSDLPVRMVWNAFSVHLQLLSLSWGGAALTPGCWVQRLRRKEVSVTLVDESLV